MKTITIVIRTPFKGDAGEFFIEGAWFDEKDAQIKKKKGYCYDYLTIPINQPKISK